ncbi:MAG TPA: FtsQ-type POTRA domain-containing protein [Terriglobales bacterium]|nr:FtsQ-type POTRA domain-containing protein [Terriglobales bacterium]
MARKSSSITPEEELEAAASEASAHNRNYDESPLDARMLDLDDEAESPFLRGQKRVPVRRGALPRKAASRLKIALVAIAVLGSAGFIWITLHQYATHSWRFRIDSSDDIAISGTKNVSRSQVLEVMASDMERNIFFVPLDVRKKQLEQVPWVQSASVMRLLPNRLKVVVHERTPVAFVEINSHIQLIDASGVIMDPPSNSQTNYSFPVVVGMTDAEPLSTRAARMKTYVQLVTALDAGGAHYSRDLSDVDLSDPDDVKATVTDPHGAVLVHLGSSNFLDRFKIYVAHVQEWRAHFQKLQSVDLRYEHQVIVNPDTMTVANEDAPAAEDKPEATAKKIASPPKKKQP